MALSIQGAAVIAPRPTSSFDVGLEDLLVSVPVADVLVSSLHPPKKPRCLHRLVEADDVVRTDVVVLCVMDGDDTEVAVMVVRDGAGAALVATGVVVGSLQPNQPGVLHVVVVIVVVVLLTLELVVVVVVVVVVLSRQPHHPGVLQVEVLVLVDDVELEVDVVISEPLLSKYFQLKQSTHSLSGAQFGGASYFLITWSITKWILWLPSPTRQPKSATVSYTH